MRLHLCFLATMLLAFMVQAEDWRLVVEDTFDRQELGGGLRVMSGDWRIDQGDLVCTKDGAIALTADVTGCQRLDLVASSTMPGDLSPLLHIDGKGMFTGYFAQFGGYNNTLNKGRRLKQFITFDDQHLMVPGQRHHIIAEFDDGVLRLLVDDQLVYSYTETQGALVGPGHAHAGIYVFTQARIHELRLFTKPFTGATSVTSATADLPADLQYAAGIPIAPGIPGPDGDLLPGGDGEDPAIFPRWGGKTTRRTDLSHSGNACLEITGEGSAVPPFLIPIDTTKTYEITGWFRSLTPETPTRVLLDARYYTAGRRPITPLSIHPVSSVAPLIADAPTGTTEIQIADTSWPQDTTHCLVFDAKADRGDLPNFSAVRIKSFKQTDDRLAITLESPLTQAYPAGTGVRLHHYLDHPRAVGDIPTTWKQLTFRIQPAPPQSHWRDFYWPGTRYLGLMILHQYTGYPERLPKDMTPPLLLIDDLTVRELP